MSSSKRVSKDASSKPTQYASVHEDPLIREAIGVLEKRIFKRDAKLTSPEGVREFLQLKLAPEASEVFAIVFLDSRHRVIAYEPMFHGTIDGAAVYPRAILKRAMEHNCAAVIIAHNHPSGETEPSDADRRITNRIKAVLEMVDVRILDHFVIGEGRPFSFAEAGWL
ncbi:MAG TPA: DNA repair protein RadC [Rhodothermales bacterium]|nr:DNA repair protein RadC [Rhodothermales bacterium]